MSKPKYTTIRHENAKGKKFVEAKINEPKGDIKYVSFAMLDDHRGIKYNVQYEGELTYKLLSIAMDHFLKNNWREYFSEEDFDRLLRDKYYVKIYDKYYHFAVALDFTRFELESKGVCGSIISWTDDGRDGNTIFQISQTGNHMWNDRYSIR